MTSMTRTFRTIPGYDCIRTPCGKGGCGTYAGSSHGVHCDDWIWAVSDGPRALSLIVFSGIFPVTAPMVTGGSSYPWGVELTTREQVLEKGRECLYVEGGRCWSDMFTVSAAEEFTATYRGNPAVRLEPGDAAIFERLERRFAELAGDYAPTPYVRCQTCDGTGTHLAKGEDRS